MNDIIKSYIEENYGLTPFDMEDKNYAYDCLIHEKSLTLFIEYKERFFKKGKIYEDIIIELVQNLQKFSSIPTKTVTNADISFYISSEETNVALGWFYKTNAKRLLYFRYEDGTPSDIIDIDFNLFKSWCMNNMDMFGIQYSDPDRRSGSINAVVELCKIPNAMYKIIKL